MSLWSTSVVMPRSDSVFPRIHSGIDVYSSLGSSEEAILIIKVHIEYKLNVLLSLYGLSHRNYSDIRFTRLHAQLEVIPHNTNRISPQSRDIHHLQIKLNTREGIGASHSKQLCRNSNP